MYCYQKFVRDQKVRQKYQEIRRSFLKDEENRLRKNQTLTQTYKKRLDGFLLSFIEKPIEINEHPNISYKPRQADTNKHISKMPFRINFNTTSERLKDVMYSNQRLDGVPFNNPSNHKFRDMASSFKTRPLKFTPSCSAMRVFETLQKYRTNEVTYYESKKANKILNSDNNSLSEQKNQKTLQKLMMPSLNKKNHINSIKTLYDSTSESKKAFVKENIGQKQSKKQKMEDEQHEKKQNKTKKNSSELANQKENVKDALIKCGLLKIKKNLSNSLQR